MTQISLIHINFSVEKLLLVHRLHCEIVTLSIPKVIKHPVLFMLMVIAYCPASITRVVKQEKISR